MAARSLKAQALQMLAQREHSRVELRRKLLARAAAANASESGEAPVAEVDALIDWLEAQRYFSPQRFVESRVHVRAPRFGNLRIRQELKRHHVTLSAEAMQALRDSELQRARAVLERRFAAPPASPAERAKRARFLAGRGFSPEVIARALRRDGAEQHATFDG